MAFIPKPEYRPVGHATVTERKARYDGAESRQVLRARLRRWAFMEITKQFAGESHSVRRSMAISRARRDYRELMRLPDQPENMKP